MGDMRLISNCPLCKDRALHVLGEIKTQQCISCGYVTSERYKLKDGQSKDNHKLYNELTDDMKKWSKVGNNRIWIPTIMTLPVGMLYPIDKDGEMKWVFAPMIEIPKEEQKKYPIDGQKNKFYVRRYDTDNPKEAKWFGELLAYSNEIMKEQMRNPDDTLPKLQHI